MVSKLVRRMVMQWGMSEKLGPIAFGDRDEQIFLGREIVQHTDYSEKTAQDIDNEVRRIVDDAYQRARHILEERLDVLHAMAQALLERETLDSEEIKVLLEGGTLEPMHTGSTESSDAADARPAGDTEPGRKRKEFPGGIPPLPDPDPTA
jgi:cell division protease FtsH